jgi:hypothetical protein
MNGEHVRLAFVQSHEAEKAARSARRQREIEHRKQREQDLHLSRKWQRALAQALRQC